MSRHLSIEPDPFPFRFAVHASARTDRGLERPTNQDNAAFADLGDRGGSAFEPPADAVLEPSAGAFVGLVCDGMGGEAGGEIASRLAVSAILDYLREQRRLAPSSNEADVARALIASIESASDRIKSQARAEPRFAKMGTTATLAALATPRSLVCAQVGDTRAYLFRRERLIQLTRDQSMVELLRSSGTVPVENIHEIVAPNIILQAVGSSSRLDVAITHTVLEPNDTVLLCSDGLWGVVDERVIASTLAAYPPKQACDELVRLSIANGAPDNVTCLVFKLAKRD